MSLYKFKFGPAELIALLNNILNAPICTANWPFLSHQERNSSRESLFWIKAQVRGQFAFQIATARALTNWPIMLRRARGVRCMNYFCVHIAWSQSPLFAVLRLIYGKTFRSTYSAALLWFMLRKSFDSTFPWFSYIELANCFLQKVSAIQVFFNEVHA